MPQKERFVAEDKRCLLVNRGFIHETVEQVLWSHLLSKMRVEKNAPAHPWCMRQIIACFVGARSSARTCIKRSRAAKI